jgi:hypothetical protein
MRLSWPVGTVRGRLARARDRLRDRLQRRGVSFPLILPLALQRFKLKSSILSECLLRSTAHMIQHDISLRVSSIVQGVILKMLTNKLKWTFLGLTFSALLVVAAGSSLWAIASQNETEARVARLQNDPEPPKQQVRAKVVKKAYVPSPETVAQKNETVESDERADRLERDKVEVELLEIKTQALKSQLQRNIQLRSQWELDRDMGMGGGGTPEEQRKSMEQYRTMVERHEIRIRNMFREYTEDRLQLARLQRRIAREAKALDQPVPESGPNSINRRIDTLEAKVDQVIDMLSRKDR